MHFLWKCRWAASCSCHPSPAQSWDMVTHFLEDCYEAWPIISYQQSFRASTLHYAKIQEVGWLSLYYKYSGEQRWQNNIKSCLAFNNWDTTFIVHFPQLTVLTKMAVTCIFSNTILASQFKKKVKIKGITMSMHYFIKQWAKQICQSETDITYPATVNKCIYKKSNKSK